MEEESVEHAVMDVYEAENGHSTNIFIHPLHLVSYIQLSAEGM